MHRRYEFPVRVPRTRGATYCRAVVYRLGAEVENEPVEKERCMGFLPCFGAVTMVCVLTWGAAEDAPGLALVRAAREQVGKTVAYDSGYASLAYPNGDVPLERGVCTDVLIRALRTAYGMDLQQLVHEDMKAHFSAYPKEWGLKHPDKNIDHRRVPNLRTYFKRKGYDIEVTHQGEDYLPGDLVTCTLPGNLAHIMVVSDTVNSAGQPFVIHNIGGGAREEDRLFEFPLTGHYRIPAPKG